jgi:hypothetical protein
LPTLVMSIVCVACWPSGTEPKFTADGTGLKLVTSPVRFPTGSR